MSGNVWEWCADWYKEDYYRNSPTNNPTGPTDSIGLRVLRGGSFIDNRSSIRCSNRGGGSGVHSRLDPYGFRLVR